MLMMVQHMTSITKSSKIATSFVTRGGPLTARHSRSDLSVTVFGATGFLGRYVVNNLGRIGCTIHVPTRGDDLSWRHLKPLGDYGKIVPHYYDLKDEKSINKALEKSQIVINLVGKHYDTKHFPPTKINWSIEDANTKTAEIIARCSRRAGIQHLVHLSSLYAHPSATSRFGKAKLAGEEAVLREFPGATIIRTGTLYGEEDRFLNWYAGLAAYPPYTVPLINEGKGVVYPVFAGDIAEAVAAIAAGEDYLETIDEVFELPGQDAFTQKQIAEYVFYQIHKDAKFVNVPTSVGVSIAKFLQMLPNPSITVDGLALLSDSEKLNAITRTDSETGKPKVIRGWESLTGITPKKFNKKAFNYLYRYRTGGHFRELRDIEEQHKQHQQEQHLQHPQ